MVSGATRRIDGFNSDGSRANLDAEQSRHDARDDENDENHSQTDGEIAQRHAHVFLIAQPITCCSILTINNSV